MSDRIEVEHQDGIAHVVLARPKVNAMDAAFLARLRDVFERDVRDPSVRGVLVRARGVCFSAGLDLREFATLDAPAALLAFLDVFDGAFAAVMACEKPVAAAVDGHALAGGLILALAADHCVYGAGRLRLGLTELAVGVPFPRIAHEIVAHALAPRAMRRLAFGAEVVDVDEALALDVGDARAKDPVAAAATWLEHVSARPAEAFASLKRAHRAPALARWRADREGDRARWIDAVLAEPCRTAVGQALA